MTKGPISSAVERLPYKQDVAGSKPASGITAIRSMLQAAVLDACERSQHSITLPSLKALRWEPVRFEGITGAVARAAGEEARD